MRTMIQLAAGVAVAGAVAAGSTALTGAGVTNSIVGSTFLGGVVSQTVTGANVTAMAITTANPGAGNNQVATILVTFDASTPDGKTVTLTTNGVAGGTTLPTGWYCQLTGATVTNASTCKASDTSYAAPTGYYTAVSTVTITVA